MCVVACRGSRASGILRTCSQSLAHPVKYRCPGMLLSSSCGLLRQLVIEFLIFLRKAAGVEGHCAENFVQRIDFPLRRIEFIDHDDLLVLQHTEAGFEISLFVPQCIIRFCDHLLQFDQELIGVLYHSMLSSMQR